MKKVNLSDVPAAETRSPRGRFRHFTQDLLAAMRQTNGDRMPGIVFPFEVKMVRLPPRAADGPYRSRATRWVYYQVILGRGTMRTATGPIEVREGDCVLLRPGEAHQLLNTGAADLVVQVITDTAGPDACHYPDSDKWGLPGQERPVRVSPADLYDGEE
jgi:mannose-6-phosphate isomerase-like protein (cupin superfamily)